MYEAAKRGYIVCVPHGHDCRYDIIIDKKGILERVQIKTIRSDGNMVVIPCRSTGKNVGKCTTKKYTSEQIECIIVYDLTTDRIAYIPVSSFVGHDNITLRYVPAANNQVKGVRWFADYENW